MKFRNKKNTNDTKNLFFGKIIKIDKPLDKLTKEGENKN